MKRLLETALNVAGIVGFLASLSYFTTGFTWEARFPRGECRISVCTPGGRPIKGAVLRVLRTGTRDPAFNFPLDNYVAGQQLISDEYGRITAIRKHAGQRLRGRAWRLFWVIKMQPEAYPYYCEITAPGFKPLTFTIWRLFKSSYYHYEEFPKSYLTVDGVEIELPVYESTFELER